MLFINTKLNVTYIRKRNAHIKGIILTMRILLYVFCKRNACIIIIFYEKQVEILYYNLQTTIVEHYYIIRNRNYYNNGPMFYYDDFCSERGLFRRRGKNG